MQKLTIEFVASPQAIVEGVSKLGIAGCLKQCLSLAMQRANQDATVTGFASLVVAARPDGGWAINMQVLGEVREGAKVAPTIWVPPAFKEQMARERAARAAEATVPSVVGVEHGPREPTTLPAQTPPVAVTPGEPAAHA